MLQVYFKNSSSGTNDLITPKSITIQGEITLNVVLDLQKSVDQELVYISLKSPELEAPTAVTAKADQKRFFEKWPISLKISYYSSGATAAAGAAAEGASYLQVGMTAVLMIVSFNAALILIKLFQMLDFFVYINVDLPLNVQTFISYFD